VRVSHEQLSVQFVSYPDDEGGNPSDRSSGDNGPCSMGPANLRAATCSESRAGLESTVVMPTRHLCGEGRSIARKQPTNALAMVAGVLGSSTQGRFFEATREAREGAGLRPATLSLGQWPERESERPIVPAKPSNAGGGKGPHFRVLLRKTRARRLAR
jgi:hypothetical protein